MHDIGGPIGMRIATAHPERIAGLIFQNFTIAVEGWDPERLKVYERLGGPETPENLAEIIRDPEILGGEPVFRGTRVPFKVLTDYLEGGDTVDQFLEQYLSVSRELTVAAIEEARLSLIAHLK
jgi:uncharacterized protein (DUF433 family)